MGMFVSKQPIHLRSPNRSASCVFLLLAPLTLSACSNTRDVYASGPWGPPRPRDATATPYTDLWSPPQYGTIGTIGGGPPAGIAPTARVVVEPMEPIGPWMKRHASGREAAPGDYARLPPAQESAPALEGIPPAAAQAPDVRNVPRNPSPRREERRLTSMTGNWTVRAAGVAPCRLHLSSVAALDLYKASTADCSNKALQSINAWSLRNGQVVLYSRGSVVLRAGGESETLYGALEGTSVMVKLSR